MESAIFAVDCDKYCTLINVEGQLVDEDLASIGKKAIHEYLEDAVAKNDNLSWPLIEGIYNVKFNIDNFTADHEQQVFVHDILKVEDSLEHIMEYEYL